MLQMMFVVGSGGGSSGNGVLAVPFTTIVACASVLVIFQDHTSCCKAGSAQIRQYRLCMYDEVLRGWTSALYDVYILARGVFFLYIFMMLLLSLAVVLMSLMFLLGVLVLLLLELMSCWVSLCYCCLS
jgi:hypothetical protein